ncbi:Uncharacterised protein [[Flavobacterium] thermophilum]|nr:Uncharacterised protein [[Flavobacterium] thermophilum]
MKSDVILNKISVIERCLKRIREEYNGDPKNLQNYTKQALHHKLYLII